MSIAEVQSRIAAIQARFGATPAGGVGGVLGLSPSASGGTDAAGGVGESFADALAAATGTTDSSGVNSLLGNTPTGPAPTTTGEQVVAAAKKYLGVPYVYGGESRSGMDCSGLVQTTFKQFGIDLPRTSREQSTRGVAVADMSQAKPGDLIFFHSPVSHVGIYVGNGQMIDAPHSGAKVRVEKVWSDVTGIRRVLPESSAASFNGLPNLGSVSQLANTLGVRTGGSALTTVGSISGVPATYADMFRNAAAKHGVPATLLAAVAKVESSFNPSVVSSAGARGLMQFMPGTARGLGIDPDVPAQAVDGAARLLKSYLEKYNGSLDLALAAYNAGPGAVKRYGGVPPYAETQAYVRRVRNLVS